MTTENSCVVLLVAEVFATGIGLFAMIAIECSVL